MSKQPKKLCLNLHIWMETWIYVIFLYGPNVPSLLNILVDPEWKPVYKVTQPVKSLTCVHASLLPSLLSLSFLSYFQLCFYHQSVVIKKITAFKLLHQPHSVTLVWKCCICWKNLIQHYTLFWPSYEYPMKMSQWHSRMFPVVYNRKM